MSVEAKLFVTCGKESFVGVMESVVTELNTYVRDKLDNYWKTHTDAINRLHFLHSENYKAQSEIFTNGVRIDALDICMLSVNFGNGDENKRSLRIFSDCSCDYDDTYEGDKIIFSIGCWDSSDEIMKVVAKSVAKFGDVYYDHNDCDEEGFVKLY